MWTYISIGNDIRAKFHCSWTQWNHQGNRSTLNHYNMLEESILICSTPVHIRNAWIVTSGSLPDSYYNPAVVTDIQLWVRNNRRLWHVSKPSLQKQLSLCITAGFPITVSICYGSHIPTEKHDEPLYETYYNTILREWWKTSNTTLCTQYLRWKYRVINECFTCGATQYMLKLESIN